MANMSEDSNDRLIDPKKTVKFMTSKRRDTANSNTSASIYKDAHASSSGPSSGDDENEDGENSPNMRYNNRPIQNSQQNSGTLSSMNTANNTTYRKSKKRAVWEVIEGYRDPNMKVQKPQNYEGILLKRRNWPMKGWHKRYFILADGILSYGKTKADMTKNKVHGTINAYLSIVSYISSSRRILIDSSTQSSAFVCHLKGRNQSEFDLWLDHLKQHRLYYQYKYTQQCTNASSNSTGLSKYNSFIQSNPNANANISNNNSSNQLSSINNSINQLIANASSGNLAGLNVLNNNGNSQLQVNFNIQNNALNRNQDNSSKQQTSKKQLHQQPSIADDTVIENHFKQVEDNLMNLSRVVSSLFLSSLAAKSTPQQSGIATVASSNSTLTAANSVISSQFQPGHQHQQSTSSMDYLTLSNNSKQIHISKSNPNLINNNEILQQMINNDTNNESTWASSTSPNTNAASSGTSADIVGSLISTMKPVPQIAFSTANSTSSNSSNGSSASSNTNGQSNNGSLLKSSNNVTNSPSLHSRKSNLNQSNQSLAFTNLNNSMANDENAFRINFYQAAKTINDQLIFLYEQLSLKRQSMLVKKADLDASVNRAQRSQSVISSVSLQDSQLQFYDAIEYFTSDTESDDDSDQDSDADNNDNTSNITNKMNTPAIVPEELQSQKILTRRRKLPASCPDTSQVSVWGILRKAIGKDLSKISLPVILNEPLSILQRLCEELEYSDLLDTASSLSDPHDRMVYIAAFVISGYASSYYRNGAKDFNPLLGETYELIRPDKGWKYIAEQVSHHPPVSACHCHSKSFIHEQVFHAKIKFWGKSMEVHPEGYSRVTLPKYNETYQWNKIVMYVHNIMGASRKIEHYGEITIRCTNGISCTITFPKSSYSSQKNEFYGDVIEDNVVKRKIFGQWHEAFLCGTDNTAKTIWRMGAMPEESNLFYGFTRFAIELNEFTENLKEELPQTDSRFRPDQRNLENGLVEKAELEKQRIEEMQRKRRKEMELRNEEHQPLWFNIAKDDDDNNNISNNSGSKSEKEWIFNNQYWNKRESGFKNLKIFPTLW